MVMKLVFGHDHAHKPMTIGLENVGATHHAVETFQLNYSARSVNVKELKILHLCGSSNINCSSFVVAN